MAEKPRLWGIDVIGTVYLLAAGVCAVVAAEEQPGLWLAVPVCLLLSLGMFIRWNAARACFKFILGLCAIVDFLLAAYFLLCGLDVVSQAGNGNPERELVDTLSRLAFALIMFFYLGRTDVRSAFLRGESDGQVSSELPPAFPDQD